MRLTARMRGIFGFDTDEDDSEKMPLYEFHFRSPDMMTSHNPKEWPSQQSTEKMHEWLNNSKGDWQYIFEMGQLWGVGFYNETDAMAFKLRWL